MKEQVLEERLKALPAKPGVYLMRDSRGEVLYVGKAVSLHNRLRSYFGSPSNLPPKTEAMMAQMGDFDFYVTDSEQEAFILECNLIKKYRPHYNVLLKDDKSYPYLKIDLTDPWPRVYLTRRLERDGSRYLGPFASASSLRHTLNLIKRLFPFRSCKKSINGADSRACIEFDIHRCLAPCTGKVSQQEYRQVIKQVILFLEGRQEEVLRRLRRNMEQAAEKMEFEKAALLRDQLQAVERVTQSQKVAGVTRGDQDVVALARAGDRAYVQVFFIRNGKLIGRDNFILEGTQGEEPEQIMTSFVQQFYASASSVPRLMLLQYPVLDTQLISDWLSSLRGGPVELRVPRRGQKRELVEMVAENARQGLEQLQIKESPEKLSAALTELQEVLHLPRLPQRMECYDISNIQGTSAVGSMVVFEKGRPKPAHYRRFRIKTVAGADDYAMLKEVLLRRFKRATEGTWAVLPDLVLIDGGRGQLNAALEAMGETGTSSVPVASLAKEQEEVFLPDSPQSLQLPRNSPALQLLQRLRDEAHRFAISYYQRLHRGRSLGSVLDEVPGIGPRRKRALLRKFGSLAAIKQASVEKLAALPGISRRLAEQVKGYL
jgi:excinuclease ABC subunit C